MWKPCLIDDRGTVQNFRKAHNWQNCQVVGAFPAPIYARTAYGRPESDLTRVSSNQRLCSRRLSAGVTDVGDGRTARVVGSGFPVRVAGRHGPCRRGCGPAPGRQMWQPAAVRPRHAVAHTAQVEDPGRSRRVLAHLGPGVLDDICATARGRLPAPIPGLAHQGPQGHGRALASGRSATGLGRPTARPKGAFPVWPPIRPHSADSD